MTPEELQRDLSGSLERLRTNYIDLYLLHRDDPAVPVDEIVSALNEQLQRGAIRAFGASNWTHTRLQSAQDYAARRGLVAFAASSPGFSLAEPVRSWPGCVSLHRARDRDACEWYARTRLPVLAWSPLAGGFFSGRFRRHDLDALHLPADRHVIEFYASDRNFERQERLAQLAASRGLSLAQLALAYVLGAPGELYAVLGCRQRSEFIDCTGALGERLSSAELDELNAIGAPSRG